MMTPPETPQKPRSIIRAEQALWIWTVWVCVYGIVQSWFQIPEIEKTITEQLQGMFTLEPRTMQEAIIAGYAILAVLSAWVIVRIGAGKNWARGSLMWGFVFQAACAACPPYTDTIRDYLADIPDYGLQAYALYLLYTKPGKAWFIDKKTVQNQ